MRATNPALPLLLLGSLTANFAFADNSDKFYATAVVGIGDLSSSYLTYRDALSTNFDKVDYDASLAAGGTFGYWLNDSWGIEAEVLYRRNEFSAVDLPALGNFDGGDFASLAIGVSALYRFDIGSGGRLQGFAGPGIVYLQEIDIDFDNTAQQEVSFETDDTAWQLKLGARYAFNDRWYADIAATFLMAEDVVMQLPANSGQTLQSSYDHLTMSVGMGIRF